MSLQFHTHVSLAPHLTMHLGGNAYAMVDVSSKDDIVAACRYAKEQSKPIFVLGGGSNTLAHDEGYDGIIMHNCLPGFEIIHEDNTSVTITIGAGEILDNIVARCVDMGLSGIEALSAIPGTAGAAPVQNVGAYGQEIADTLVSLEAYDRHAGQFVTLQAADCEFSYRHSIFRGRNAGQYIISSITLRLSKKLPQPPFYQAVQDYLTAHDITQPTPRDIRQAVTTIRANKRPDPPILPNTGSFFKNAIVDSATFTAIQQKHPTVPYYTMPNRQVKIPSGWLIEQAGLKGVVSHGMKVHDKNAVVLINQSAHSYNDLAAARGEIIAAVQQKFGITISQEPLEIPPAPSLQ